MIDVGVIALITLVVVIRRVHGWLVTRVLLDNLLVAEVRSGHVSDSVLAKVSHGGGGLVVSGHVLVRQLTLLRGLSQVLSVVVHFLRSFALREFA